MPILDMAISKTMAIRSMMDIAVSHTNDPGNDMHGDIENDCDNDSDSVGNHNESPHESLSSPPKAPLTPQYPPQPKDESEAHESFRRSAIDKAHEISALSWPEHIQNHDVHRFRNSVKLRPRLKSTAIARSGSKSVRSISQVLSQSLSMPAPIEEEEGAAWLRSSRSFHSVSARSTLRKRRNVSYSDLQLATVNSIEFDPPMVPSQSCIILGEVPKVHKYNDDIEIVAAPAPPAVETEIETTADRKRLATALANKGKSPPRGKSKKPPIEGVTTWENYCNRHVQLLLSLALFSYLGQFFRYFTEHFFGKACHQPETVDWDPIWKAFCISSPGTTESMGGAFFIDLPTNIIGCFLMGLMVSGDGESIAVNLPMAALPRNHFFQDWVVTHVGLRTGFCGALTTFASWNTQMVIMLCGGSTATEVGASQWMSVIWGYLVGFYSALQSYQFGVAVAFCLSRYFNPHLAREADTIVDKKAIGVLIHRDLPDFERRFLHSIVLEGEQHDDTHEDQLLHLPRYGEECYESYYGDHIHHLLKWKETTDDHRHGFRGSRSYSNERSYVTELYEIEKNLLVDRIEPRIELLEIARDAGWDVESLKNWTSALIDEEQGIGARSVSGDKNRRESDGNDIGDGSMRSDDDDDEISVAETHIEDAYFSTSYSSLTEVGITLVCFLVVTGLLLAGFFHYSSIENNGESSETSRIDMVVASSYKAQFLSSLVSPLGTYCRWYLSRLNGSLRDKKWEWLPIGTFLANMIASSVSALCAGILLGLDDGPSFEASVVIAIQSGFAGSCSTVSTFCTETTGLLRALPRAFWGYYYGFGSMLCALVVGFVSYVWAVL